jgi:predicted HNH restriction endonuclease
MRKFLVITIPIVTLAFFVCIMLSGSFFKKPLGKGDNIPESIQLILQDVESENWEGANNKTDNLSNSWKKIVKRIQFSSERDEINAFDVSIARLRGAIDAKDKSDAFLELNEAYEHWDGLGK